jgi:hypothetical protein
MSNDEDRLKGEFDRDMRRILEREGELGLCSTRFRQMLQESDGWTVAKKLLSKSEPPPNTFTWLGKQGRLDLTMEFYVYDAKYQSIFTDDDRAVAKFRLEQGD